MNKKIFLENVKSIQEDFGADFPKVNQICEKTINVLDRSFVRSLSYFRNNISNFTDIEEIKSVFESVDNYIENNYIRLNVELVKERLLNSNNSIAPTIVPRVNKVLESEDENMTNAIRNQLSDYKFIDSVKELFSVVENRKLEQYENNKTEESASNDVEKMILRALKSIDQTKKVTESRILKKFLRLSKNSHRLTVADQISNVTPDNYSEKTRDLIAECVDIVENNENRLKVVKLVENLQNHRNHVLFKKPIKVLKNVADKQESVLENNLEQELDGFNWVPGVSDILDDLNKSKTQRIVENRDQLNYEPKHPIAPIVKEDERYLIKLGTKIYEYKDGYNVAENVNTKSKQKLQNLQKMIEPFKYNGGSFIFEGNKKSLEITVTENSGKIKFGNTELSGNQLDTAISFLGNNVNENVIQGAKYLTENGLKNFALIDEAVEIGEKDNVIYVISDENKTIYNGQVVENESQLVSEIKTHYGVDISKFVINKLDRDTQAAFFINEQEKKADLLVEFFSSQISKIDNSVNNFDNHPGLFELRTKLTQQLKDAKKRQELVNEANQKFEQDGFKLLTEDEDEPEEDEDMLSNEETVLNYFYQQSDNIPEDELSEEHFDMAEKEVRDFFSENGKISKGKIDEILGSHIETEKTNEAEDFDKKIVNTYLDNLEDDMMGHDHAVHKTAQQLKTDDTDVIDTLKRNKIEFNED